MHVKREEGGKREEESRHSTHVEDIRGWEKGKRDIEIAEDAEPLRMRSLARSHRSHRLTLAFR